MEARTAPSKPPGSAVSLVSGAATDAAPAATEPAEPLEPEDVLGSGPQPDHALPLRIGFATVGTIALGLGVVGILVPVLPTTPFLLLAAACYARASTRLYAWLLGQPALGPIVAEWRRSRSLPPGVKVRAVVVVGLTFGLSILLVDAILLRLGLVLTAAVLIAFLLRIPTRVD